MIIRLYPYATDSRERDFATFYLALASLGIIWLLYELFKHHHVEFPWYISSPSTFGVFAALWTLTTRALWRSPLLHSLKIVRIPDLNGTWEGTFRTSYDDYKAERPCSLQIEQSWVDIGITFNAGQSNSWSVAAGIQAEVVGGARLTYQYYNEPKTAVAMSTMDIHYGTQWLTLSEDAEGRWLKGDYYTSRGSGQTRGRLEMRLQET